MRIRQLRIDRMPGVEGRTIDGLGDGITVVTGPNESGKTSLVRAARALLWGIEDAGDRPWDIAATVELDGALRSVEREGRRTRWSRADGAPVEPPTVPDARHAGCYTIELDQLARRDDPTGTELARQLRTELDGGVDIAAARASVANAAPTGRSEKSALRDARSAYGDARKHQTAVAAAEHELADLERARDDLADQVRRRPVLERAVTWRRAIVRRESALDAIAQLDAPRAALDAVQEQDRDAWEQLLHAVRVAEGSERDAAERVRQAQEAIERSPLAMPLDPEQLERLSVLVGNLERCQATVERLQLEAARVAGERARAQESLGAIEDVLEGEVGPADIEQVRRLGGELAAIDARRAGMRRVGELLAAADSIEARAGAGDVADRSARASSVARPALLATIAFGALAAVWLGISLHPAGWGVLVALVACGVIALRALRPAEAEMPTPASATPTDQQVEQRAIARELERLEHDEAATRASLTQLGARLGIDVVDELGAFADWLARIAAARDADARHAGARAELQESASQRDQALHAVVDAMEGTFAATVHDVATARAAREQLARTSTELADAQAALPGFVAAHATACDDLAAARGHRERWLSARGIDATLDDAVATGHLERLWSLGPAYRDARTALQSATLAHDDALAGIPEQDRAELLGRPLDELEQELAGTEQAHQRERDLTARLERARADVEHAIAGHELTDALAARDDARAELQARRDEALVAHAAAFLVDHAAREYERDNAPPIIEDANRMLAAATGERYAIAIADGQLAARRLGAERAATLDLGALSSGTRAQLLITARIAFARHAERGEQLPIFVDEALSTTDPDRFDAVVRTLAAIARDDDRQIVYLTSNPADAAAIGATLSRDGSPPPTLIDLGAFSAAGARHAELDVTPRAPVEPPLPGESPAAWAHRIGVPALRPYADTADTHVWHVHEPDLRVVEQLLRSRLATVGQVRAVDERGLLDDVIGAAVAADVRIRQHAFDAFIDAWRVGRERPLERADDLRRALEHAGINLDRWHEPLHAWVQEHDRLGSSLIAALREPGARRDERFKGFGTKQVDALADALVELGYVPAGDPLDDATILATVVARVGVDAAAGATSIADHVHAWLQRAARADIADPDLEE